MITDGEQTRLDFNLSFYGFLAGIELEGAPPRRFGPPAHDQRGRHQITGELAAPDGLGVVDEFARLRRLAPDRADAQGERAGAVHAERAARPQRRLPRPLGGDRGAAADRPAPSSSPSPTPAAREITVDEPSMSCYAYREDPERFVDIFNRTVAPVVGRCRLSTHLCFGNYKGHAVGPRRYAPMFPAFNAMTVDEIHVEMASRELAELDVIATIAEHHDVAVGIVDVKSYFVEPPELIAERVRECLQARPARAARVRPRLRPVADGALGGPQKLAQHGRRRAPGARGGRATDADRAAAARRRAARRHRRRRRPAPTAPAAVVARPGRLPRPVATATTCSSTRTCPTR